MFDEAQLFSLIIAGFYLVDGVKRLQAGAVVFRAGAGGPYTPDTPDQRAATGRESGDFVLLPLLPWRLGLAFEPLPLHLTPEGLESPGPELLPPLQRSRSLRFARKWEGLTRVEVEARELKIPDAAGSVSLEAIGEGGPARPVAPGRLWLSTELAANALSEQLLHLSQLPREQRPAAIDGLWAQILDLQQFQTQHATLTQTLKPLAWSGTLIFAFWFGLVPLVGILNLPVPLLWVLGLHFLLLMPLLGLYWRAQGRLLTRPRWRRILETLQLLVSPADAMRSAQLLAYQTSDLTHPLVAARILCDQAGFERFARRVLMGFEGGETGLSPGAQAARQAHRARLVAWLKGQGGVAPEALLQPPQPQDASCLSYCPRCDQQSTAKEGRCTSCSGVALRPLGQG